MVQVKKLDLTKGGGKRGKSQMLREVYHCYIELQSYSKCLGTLCTFANLWCFCSPPPPTPLPTPNTMLTFTQSKPTIPTFPWGGGGGGGVRGICKTHFKIMCHQLPICPKDFWPGMEVYLVWPVNRFTLSTTVSKYDKQPIYFFL